MADLQVTPESLAGAADRILSAVRADVPQPVAGSVDAYGHAGLGAAAAEFGAALGSAVASLAGAAEHAATALRDTAREYAARERSASADLATLLGVGR